MKMTEEHSVRFPDSAAPALTSLLFLALLAAAPELATADARSPCLAFADHAVSQIVRIQGNRVPQRIEDLAGEYATVQNQGDPLLPDLLIRKTRNGGATLTSAADSDNGKMSKTHWTVRLPMSDMVFHMERKPDACVLKSIEVEERGLLAKKTECDKITANPKDPTVFEKVTSRRGEFLARLKRACEIAGPYFEGATRTSVEYGAPAGASAAGSATSH